MNLQNALTDKSISFSSRDNSFRGPAKMSYLRKNIFNKNRLYVYVHNIFHFVKKASSGENKILYLTVWGSLKG